MKILMQALLNNHAGLPSLLKVHKYTRLPTTKLAAISNVQHKAEVMGHISGLWHKSELASNQIYLFALPVHNKPTSDIIIACCIS